MKLSWTLLAVQDLEQALDFIACDNPSAAARVGERIEKAVNALTIHPHLGRLGRVEGTRELVVARTPFVIPYRIAGERIEILAIIHGARRWPESF